MRAAITVREIDDATLHDTAPENVALLSGEVASMWGEPQRLLGAGFGYCAIAGRTIAGWCTAEDVSGRACGIGVETVPEYQGQGIATALGAAMVGECARRDAIPYWDSWASNLPSVRVAAKLGFRLVKEYQTLFVRS